MLNIQIGIKVVGATATVFYCGSSGAELSAAHKKELSKSNGAAKFFSVRNPMMAPLQSVVVSTEDHPDVVAANERRKVLDAELAEKQAEAARARKFSKALKQVSGDAEEIAKQLRSAAELAKQQIAQNNATPPAASEQPAEVVGGEAEQPAAEPQAEVAPTAEVEKETAPETVPQRSRSRRGRR